MKQWPIKRVKLADIKLAEYNPRKISDRAFEGLGASIEHFGLVEDIVVNEQTGNIVGGNQKYRYLIEQGETEADVIMVDLLEDEEVALNIAFNNPEIRGLFTQDAVELLDSVSASLGSVFEDLRLDDLKKKLDKFDKPFPPSGPNVPDSNGVNPDSFIAVVCPECGARWRKSDNEVIT